MQTVLPHAPVDRNTLDNSVTELVGALSTEPSDFADGYEIWKESFETGDAGVFDIPVTQIIEFVEDTVNREFHRTQLDVGFQEETVCGNRNF